VQVDALAVRLRPRNAMEASDLGVRLCQHAAGSVYSCFAAVAVPVMAFIIATYQIADWLPALALWWIKPWLDRTILYVLGRAAFGQTTSPRDVWRAQRQVWWNQLFFTLTLRRLSPWRALTQPAYQLEGLPFLRARRRARQIRRRYWMPAAATTLAFGFAETALSMAIGSLLFWLAPAGMAPDVSDVLSGQLPGVLALIVPMSYAIAVLFLEPFYVAAGFAMYLNRRTELEAWDIEQEFRRAFAA
jgi:hypothetical protein